MTTTTQTRRRAMHNISDTAVTESPVDGPWESELSDLLSELSATQDELLRLLGRKRELLIKSDTAGLAELQEAEQQLIDPLQRCQQRRSSLLERAAREGLPSESIQSLAVALQADDAVGTAVDGSSPKDFSVEIGEAESRARLLRHQSLTNWVLVQRTLIHLSQMLEIIATGGRGQPTYGKGTKPTTSGSLVDQAV